MLKKRNYSFPVLRYSTRKLELDPYTCSTIVTAITSLTASQIIQVLYLILFKL